MRRAKLCRCAGWTMGWVEAQRPKENFRAGIFVSGRPIWGQENGPFDTSSASDGREIDFAEAFSGGASV